VEEEEGVGRGNTQRKTTTTTAQNQRKPTVMETESASLSERKLLMVIIVFFSVLSLDRLNCERKERGVNRICRVRSIFATHPSLFADGRRANGKELHTQTHRPTDTQTKKLSVRELSHSLSSRTREHQCLPLSEEEK
jgi:hypothetical protein